MRVSEELIEKGTYVCECGSEDIVEVTSFKFGEFDDNWLECAKCEGYETVREVE